VKQPRCYKRVELRNGETVKVCWLDLERRVISGHTITIEGDPRHWLVTKVYDIRLDSPPRRDWNVGGISGKGMSMRTKKSFDEKCYELAEYFMREPTGKWTKEDVNELAELIQRTIEDFMHDKEE
jgi:hypothetical protein